jgi:hypothetical protein
MIDKPSMSSDADRQALAHMAHVVAAFAYRCHRMEAIQSEHKAGPLTDRRVASTVGDTKTRGLQDCRMLQTAGSGDTEVFAGD